MLRMSWTEKGEICGTIKVKNGVRQLGIVIDDDGNRWDIHGIYGAAGVKGQKQYVSACPLSELHPYFYDTSNSYYSYVHQRWEPYLIESECK